MIDNDFQSADKQAGRCVIRVRFVSMDGIGSVIDLSSVSIDGAVCRVE